MKYRNIVLIGMPGTGKSTVGKALASKLGWAFVDTDAQIEEEEGRSIGAIFAEQGEPIFRLIESRTIAAVLREERQIVATGGGAVLAEQNRTAMQANGLVVALKASADVIIERVSQNSDRPLVQGNVAERVHRIMEERKHAYDFADVSIDTTGTGVEAIVDQIVRLAQPGKA